MKAILRRLAMQAIGRFSPATLAAQRVRQELRNGEPELALLPLLGDRQKTFLDVGANNGVYAYYALDHFARVVAVEAYPDLTVPLQRILGAKGQVLPVALSDHDGTARLWIPRLASRDVTTRSSLEADANPGFDLREVEVPVTSIDALGLKDVGVIKIDVEGHEFAVLQGARATLSAQKPVCIVEVEERHTPGGVARAFAFFEGLGYRAHYLHRGKLCEGAMFDAATLQPADQAKDVGSARSADYVNNFLFVHPDNDAGLERVRAAYQ